MKPAAFELFTPSTVDEAVALLTQYGDDAKLISGGQSLVPAMNMRLANPKYLIDLNRIQALAYIRKEEGVISIGGMTRHHALESSTLLQEQCPLLSDAARMIGHLAIRYRGTIGGSLAHADPAATLPTALMTLDGTIRATGPDGVREISPAEFFYGIFTTSLQSGEILTEVRVPVQQPGTGHAFATLTRRHGDFPIVSVAALLERAEGKIVQARLSVGGVNPVPTRIDAAEQLLCGAAPDAALFDRAAEMAAEAMDAETDLHATAGYRVHMVKVYVADALTQAWSHTKEAK